MTDTSGLHGERGAEPLPPRDPAAVWDMARLGAAPRVWRWPAEFDSEVTPVFVEGEPWRGRGTRCFAYVGVPPDATESAPAPGIVLVHGGSGTAYPEWVRRWVRRGYAAIAVDTSSRMYSGTRSSSGEMKMKRTPS